MMKLLFALLSLFVGAQALSQTSTIPYPILFVHGLASDAETFATTVETIRSTLDLRQPKVFHVCLNHDNINTTALLDVDVVEIGWTLFQSDFLTSINPNDKLFLINFSGSKFANIQSHGNHQLSNQSAIYKQGRALQLAIQSIRTYTGSEKVVLVGHSMGGLAIREYLQRKEQGLEKWWIVPGSLQGHKVARAVTIGTPHFGSNFMVGLGTSEAIRDLRWSHGLLPPVTGVYLFGGNENDLFQFNFVNTDVNCNGLVNLTIQGIDESSSSRTYNPNMPLPLDIPYTYLTSNSSGSGDGIVDLDRQWLHAGSTALPTGLADTILMLTPHLEETGDTYPIVRAIDEPDTYALAYSIELNNSYKGLITVQPELGSSDADVYRMIVPSTNNLVISVEGTGSGVNGFEILDSFGGAISSLSIQLPYVSAPISLSAGTYYIKLIGSATLTTWQNPYTFRVTIPQPSIALRFPLGALMPHTTVMTSLLDHTNAPYKQNKSLPLVDFLNERGGQSS
ncbi:MAG: lipase family alpha/beta hydrolase, partial [Bacteroidota bacterium]